MATWNDLAPQVIAGLSRDLNLTPQQAAGIVGQLGYESNGLQAINEQNPTVPGSRGGFGWAQWTGPRRQAFEQWAADKGLNVSDPNANYGFLVSELQNGPESGVLGELRNAKTAEDAGRIFTDQFLRPGVPNYPQRESWTQKALDFLIPPAAAGTVSGSSEGPWTKFAPPAPAPEGPWVRFQAGAQTAASATDAPTFSDGKGDTVTLHYDQSPPGAASPQAPAQSDSSGYLPQIGSGLLEGVTGVLGAPVDLTNAALGLGMKGINAAFGTNLQPSAAPFGGAEWFRRGLPFAPPSPDTGPQMARRIAQSVGAYSVPALGSLGNAGQLAAGLTTAVGGGLGGAVAQQAFPNSPTAQAIGELAGSMGTGAAVGNLANRLARQVEVPTVQELKQQAADQFSDARAQGVAATPQQTQNLANDMHAVALQEGLVSPTGRISEAYPKAKEALRMVDDYAAGPMNVEQMQAVRKTLADAAGASDLAERRIATKMLNIFDDFTSGQAPQLAQGRALYARAMRGEQLETLRELAESRAAQFSNSGRENALRTEYRNLSRRIIKGQERGWTPEQTEAIRRVAEGTPYGNALRNVGRMAPKGPVSFMSTAGIPAALGTAIGGFPVGAAMATGASMLSYGARHMAEQQTLQNALLAEQLARKWGVFPPAPSAALWPSMLGAGLAGQAAIR